MGKKKHADDEIELTNLENESVENSYAYTHETPPDNSSELRQLIIAYIHELNRIGYNTINIAYKTCKKFNLNITPIKLSGGGKFSSLLDTVYKMDIDKVRMSNFTK